MQWNEQSPTVVAAREIAERLRHEGHEVYWVGGCVRDTLLGLGPKDIDVATDAPPDVVRRLFPRNVAIGAHFGEILVMHGGVETEVATFRRDGEYVDARHPTAVTFGSPRDDALRRDFTINALFYDPVADELIDHVGGQADLDARILRAIGEPTERFAEDALRLIRAVRFGVGFDLDVEPRTLAALRESAERITRISAERVRDELVRILTGPRPGDALRMLDTTGLLGHVLPEVAAMKGVEQPDEFHPEGDVFIHTALVLDHLPNDPSPTLALGALLHDIGKPPTFERSDRIRFNRHHTVGSDMAKAACRRLRLSNAERRQVAALVVHHMDFLNVTRMRPSRLRRLLALDAFDEHLELHRADCLASHGSIDNYTFCKEKLDEFAREDAEILPPPLLSGHDLIAAGHAPGPRMGEMLGALREAQLDGELDSPQAARAWVAEHFPL